MKPIIYFNICIFILYSIYFFISFISKPSFVYFLPKEVNNNNSKMFYQIRERVNRTDGYLKKLSQSMVKRNDSKLIYPNEMLEMTSITINHKTCSEELGRDLLLVVFVFIRANDSDRRQLIRKTWAQDIKSDPRSRLYFATGLSGDPDVEEGLTQENDKFNDILQFGYYEEYYNCTIKATALLRWTTISCPFVKFMLKVDDDTLLLPKNLLEFIDKTEPDSILGHVAESPYTKVFRETTSKWSISIEDYPESDYPEFIINSYLIPGIYIPGLYKTAIYRCLPALPFEDAYITGIVAEKAGVRRSPMSNLRTTPCHDLDFEKCSYHNIAINLRGFDVKNIWEVWMVYKNGI